MLTNDHDANAGDNIRVVQFSFGGATAAAGETLSGAFGTLTIGAEGSYHYVASLSDLAAGASATDRFSYTASDSNGVSATADLTFNVTSTAVSALIGSLNHDPASLVGQIYRLYDAAFDRSPEEPALEVWHLAMQNGLSLLDVARGFVNSPEFQTRYGTLSNHDFVQLLYKNALGRDADADALSQGWIDALDHGADRGKILLGISDSAEHIEDTQPAFTSGVFVPDGVTSEIARLYYTVLGRVPEPEGLQNWVTLANDGTPLSQIAAGFTGSVEFQTRYGTLSNHDFVELLYQNALGRDADADASSGWMTAPMRCENWDQAGGSTFKTSCKLFMKR